MIAVGIGALVVGVVLLLLGWSRFDHPTRKLRGQDMLDRTPAKPEPLPPNGEPLPPVVVPDINDYNCG